VLFIEYDVHPHGQIELVALINAVEEHGADADSAAWLAWRSREFEDHGLGCVGVSPADLTLMEQTEDPDELRAVVEHIVLDDRATKGSVPVPVRAGGVVVFSSLTPRCMSSRLGT